MARKVRHSRLESRSARLKLSVRKKPYTGPTLARGVLLLYRRNKHNGSWVVKAAAGDGVSYWTKAFADADDYDEADGEKILTFYQAQDKAKELARGGDVGAAANAAPVTVDGALKAYETDLKARNAGVYNARYPRFHLTAALLAKPVGLLRSSELKTWRDALLGKLKPATINRLGNALCAALALAAQHDKRIANRDAWEVGLAGLPDAQVARNVILSDARVSEFVVAATARDAKLGLFLDVLATTGCRPNQATRLLVEDLDARAQRPRLMMPRSGKGGGRNRSAKKALRFPVPVTVALAAKLKQAAKGRAPDAPLLTRSTGQPWNADPSRDYRRVIREIVAGIGLDPDVVTVYALRHSSIVRMLLKNVPVRLVASLHNTSVAQIESTYSKFIAEYAGDDYARAALLEHVPSSPAADNIIPLGGR